MVTCTCIILAWRIPRTEEPGGLQSTGSKESDTTEQNWECTPPYQGSNQQFLERELPGREIKTSTFRLQEFLPIDIFPGQTCALAVFLHSLCTHDKAIGRTLDKDWCWGKKPQRAGYCQADGESSCYLKTLNGKRSSCVLLASQFAPPATFMVHNPELLHWAFLIHAQLHLTLCDPMDCSPPGSSVHGISQACHFLLQGIFPTQRQSPHLHVSCIAGDSLPPSHLESPFVVRDSLKRKILKRPRKESLSRKWPKLVKMSQWYRKDQTIGSVWFWGPGPYWPPFS